MNIASKLYPQVLVLCIELCRLCVCRCGNNGGRSSADTMFTVKSIMFFFLQVSVLRLRNYCCEHSRFSACSTFDSNFPHTAYTIYLPTGKSWLSQYVIYRSSMPMGYHNSFCVHELHTERLIYAVTYKYAHGFVEPTYFWLWKLTVYRSF